MNENIDYWSNNWVNILTKNLKHFMDRDGVISYQSSRNMISTILELNEGLDVVEECLIKREKISYMADINNIYLLTRECASKKSPLKILFETSTKALEKILGRRGYPIKNYLDPSDYQEFRNLEISKFESMIRNSCNNDKITLSKEKSSEQLLDETTSLLVGSYKYQK